MSPIKSKFKYNLKIFLEILKEKSNLIRLCGLCTQNANGKRIETRGDTNVLNPKYHFA